MVEGKYYLNQYVVLGKKAIKELGLNPENIYQAAQGLAKTAHGCYCKYIENDEVDDYNEMPKEVGDYLVRCKSILRVKPILGTIIKQGPYNGIQFVVFGAKSLRDMGFDQGHVSKACNGKLKYHRGCTWEYITNEEADKYDSVLNKEILDWLMEK